MPATCRPARRVFSLSSGLYAFIRSIGCVARPRLYRMNRKLSSSGCPYFLTCALKECTFFAHEKTVEENMRKPCKAPYIPQKCAKCSISVIFAFINRSSVFLWHPQLCHAKRQFLFPRPPAPRPRRLRLGPLRHRPQVLLIRLPAPPTLPGPRGNYSALKSIVATWVPSARGR